MRKTDSSGTATYRRDGTTVTSPVLSDGGATYTPGISEPRSGATTYEHSDYLGSITRQTNASQTTTATRAFDAFGLLVASTGTPQGPFGFVGVQGYQADPDSGLMLLGHRYYDPSTGRFLTRDPAYDGRNWYGYCENNPLTDADPDGQKPGDQSKSRDAAAKDAVKYGAPDALFSMSKKGVGFIRARMVRIRIRWGNRTMGRISIWIK